VGWLGCEGVLRSVAWSGCVQSALGHYLDGRLLLQRRDCEVVPVLRMDVQPVARSSGRRCVVVAPRATYSVVMCVERCV
jgi:hypothetical protein